MVHSYNRDIHPHAVGIDILMIWRYVYGQRNIDKSTIFMESINDTVSVYTFVEDSDGWMYNSNSVNDCVDPFRRDAKHIVYRHCNITKFMDCRLSTLTDANMQIWTLMTFKFRFSVHDEHRAGGFESLLQNGLSVHPCLHPTIIIRRGLQDSIRYDNREYLSDYHLGEHMNKSQSKPRRRCHTDIHLSYDVYVRGTARPLYKIMKTNTPATSSDHLGTLHGLRDKIYDSFSTYLYLVLQMVKELEHVHHEGLCHNNIDDTSFLLYHIPPTVHSEHTHRIHQTYTPPLLPPRCDDEMWGVQLMGIWQCTPSGGEGWEGGGDTTVRRWIHMLLMFCGSIIGRCGVLDLMC